MNYNVVFNINTIDIDIDFIYYEVDKWLVDYLKQDPNRRNEVFTERIFSEMIYKYTIQAINSIFKTEFGPFRYSSACNKNDRDILRNKLILCRDVGISNPTIVNFTDNNALRFNISNELLPNLSISINVNVYYGLYHMEWIADLSNYDLGLAIRKVFKERFSDCIKNEIIPKIYEYQIELNEKKIECDRKKQKAEEIKRKRLESKKEEIDKATRLYEKRKANSLKNNERKIRHKEHIEYPLDYYDKCGVGRLLNEYKKLEVTYYNTKPQNKVIETVTKKYKIKVMVNKAAVKRILEFCRESLIEKAKKDFINSLEYKNMFGTDKELINFFKIRVDISTENFLLITFRFKDELINIFRDMQELDFINHPSDR